MDSGHSWDGLHVRVPGTLPSSVCLENSVIESDSYLEATKSYSFTALPRVALMALEVFQPVSLTNAVVKL